MLKRQGRVSYRALKRQIDLDDDCLVVYINRAGNESGLLQVDLPALTDAV